MSPSVDVGKDVRRELEAERAVFGRRSGRRSAFATVGASLVLATVMRERVADDLPFAVGGRHRDRDRADIGVGRRAR